MKILPEGRMSSRLFCISQFEDICATFQVQFINFTVTEKKQTITSTSECEDTL